MRRPPGHWPFPLTGAVLAVVLALFWLFDQRYLEATRGPAASLLESPLPTFALIVFGAYVAAASAGEAGVRLPLTFEPLVLALAGGAVFGAGAVIAGMSVHSTVLFNLAGVFTLPAFMITKGWIYVVFMIAGGAVASRLLVLVTVRTGRLKRELVVPAFLEGRPARRAGLAGFLKNQLRPVLKRARPVFSNLATAAGRSGKNNDTSDLLSSLIPLESKAGPGVDAAIGALDASQEEVAETRAWSPDIYAALAKLGAASANYDVNGHYTRVRPTAMGLYQLNGTTIEPASTAVYSGLDFISGIQRCPGGSTQPIAGSNPFLDDGNLVGKCDPTQVP